MNNASQLEKKIKEHRKIDGFIGISSNPEPPVPYEDADIVQY